MSGKNLKVFSVGLLTVGLVLLSKGVSFASDKNARFQVFSTSNLNGYVKPCG